MRNAEVEVRERAVNSQWKNATFATRSCLSRPYSSSAATAQIHYSSAHSVSWLRSKVSRHHGPSFVQTDSRLLTERTPMRYCQGSNVMLFRSSTQDVS